MINIPAYTPEFNPCGQVWKYIKQRFKNRVFKAMEAIREWLGKTVRDMSEKTIIISQNTM